MKCPECDSTQPDNSVICSNCSLSFEAWKSLNQAALPQAPAPENEMTFPVPPEEEPASLEKTSSPSMGIPATNEGGVPPPPVNKRTLNWVYFAGLAAAGVILLGVFFLNRGPFQPAVAMVVPTPTSPAQMTPTFTSTASVGPSTPREVMIPVQGKPSPTPSPQPEAIPVEPAPSPTESFTPVPVAVPEKSTPNAKGAPATLWDSGAGQTQVETLIPSPTPASRIFQSPTPQQNPR